MFLTCLLSRYQIMILELLFLSTSERQTMNWSPHLDESAKFQCIEIHVPNGVNVSENTEYASQAALWGIEVFQNLVKFILWEVLETGLVYLILTPVNVLLWMDFIGRSYKRSSVIRFF